MTCYLPGRESPDGRVVPQSDDSVPHAHAGVLRLCRAGVTPVLRATRPCGSLPSHERARTVSTACRPRGSAAQRRMGRSPRPWWSPPCTVPYRRAHRKCHPPARESSVLLADGYAARRVPSACAGSSDRVRAAAQDEECRPPERVLRSVHRKSQVTSSAARSTGVRRRRTVSPGSSSRAPVRAGSIVLSRRSRSRSIAQPARAGVARPATSGSRPRLDAARLCWSPPVTQEQGQDYTLCCPPRAGVLRLRPLKETRAGCAACP